MNELRSRGGAPIMSPVKRIILFIILVILIACIFFGYKHLKSREILNAQKSIEISKLQQELKAENDKADELSKTKNDKTSDEDYEALARKELGLIKDDEIVIKPR